MLKIRLRRQGKKKQPVYRIVVAESRAPRDGAFVETIGLYNPRTDPETLTVNEERLDHWVGHGAQPSEALDKLLRRKGIGGREPLPHRERGAKPAAQPATVAARPPAAPTAAATAVAEPAEAAAPEEAPAAEAASGTAEASEPAAGAEAAPAAEADAAATDEAEKS